MYVGRPQKHSYSQMEKVNQNPNSILSQFGLQADILLTGVPFRIGATIKNKRLQKSSFCPVISTKSLKKSTKRSMADIHLSTQNDQQFNSYGIQLQCGAILKFRIDGLNKQILRPVRIRSEQNQDNLIVALFLAALGSAQSRLVLYFMASVFCYISTLSLCIFIFLFW